MLTELPDTIRLTDEEMAAIYARIEALLAESPPNPPMTAAELDDLAAREGHAVDGWASSADESH